jgi:hypothetical protein
MPPKAEALGANKVEATATATTRNFMYVCVKYLLLWVRSAGRREKLKIEVRSF